MTDMSAGDWMDVIYKAVTLIGLLWVAIQQRARANTAALAVHEDRLDIIDVDLAGIRERLAAAPGHDDIQRLHDRVSETRKELSTVAENVAATRALVQAIDKAVDLINRTHIGERP